jgi:hypothetical protein
MLTISVDNASANEIAIEWFKKKKKRQIRKLFVVTSLFM